GRSKVFYPEGFPTQLRSVIEGCLERDPSQRFPSVPAVIQELRGMLRELNDDRPRDSRKRIEQTSAEHARQHAIQSMVVEVPAPTITGEIIANAERAVYAWGYNVERSLGRVRGHPIFLASPRPDLVSSGQFPDANIFPKLVTVIDLTKVA